MAIPVDSTSSTHGSNPFEAREYGPRSSLNADRVEQVAVVVIRAAFVKPPQPRGRIRGELRIGRELCLKVGFQLWIVGEHAFRQRREHVAFDVFRALDAPRFSSANTSPGLMLRLSWLTATWLLKRLASSTVSSISGDSGNYTAWLRSDFHGPVMATVRPGVWMFTKSVEPSGEKHAPANSPSEVLASL